MGYHKTEIKKGKIGEFSKIEEEFEELKDGYNQGDIILQLVELSDMIGAIEHYISRWNLKIGDLKDFSDKTKQAFEEGIR